MADRADGTALSAFLAFRRNGQHSCLTCSLRERAISSMNGFQRSARDSSKFNIGIAGRMSKRAAAW
ncbi:hypothetical protein CRM79_19715 [Pantoea agglomerans]|nr:hypothetical protein CRM79_19715 [Pantoea agglomerans]